MAFDGGHLRLYAQREASVADEQADEYVEIAPKPNTIVFFPADWQHEVTVVERSGERSATDDEIERWTVNGWFRAGDLGRAERSRP